MPEGLKLGSAYYEITTKGDVVKQVRDELKKTSKLKIDVPFNLKGDIAKDIKSQVSKVPKGIRIPVTADTKGMMRGLARETKKARDPIKVPVKVNTSKMNAEMKTAGGKAGKVFGGAMATATGVAMAGVSKGIMDNLNIEQGTATLKGQLGLTGADAAKAGTAAGQAYRDNFGGTMEEVNAAIRAVSTNFGGLAGMAPAQLKAITEQALGLSSTMGVDVNASTLAAAKLVKTGLAPSYSAAFDMITRGFQTGLNSSDDFLETLNEYSPQFKRLGISGPTALNLLRAGLKGGARDTDTIADAFKEFSIRSIDGSKTTAEGYQALGLDAKKTAATMAKGGAPAEAMTMNVLKGLQKIRDPIKRNAAGVALFGTQWEDTVRNILPNLAGVTGGMEGVTGSTDKMNEAVGSTGAAKIETMKRSFNGWLQSMANSTGAMGVVTAGLATFGAGALGAAGNLGMAAVGMKSLGGIGSVTPMLKGVAGGFKVMSMAILTSPIFWIIAGLVAVGVALYLLWKKSETFRKIVTTVLHAVATAGIWLWHMLQGAWNGIKAGFSWLVGAIGFAWNNILKPIFNIIKWYAWNVVLGPARIAFALLKTAIHVAFTAIEWTWNHVLSPVFNGVKTGVGLLVGAFESAKKGIATAWNAVRDVVKAPIKFIIETVLNNGIIDGINWLTSKVGIPNIPHIPLPKGFASGGVLPGYSPGRDNQLAYVSGGEAIMRPEWTRAVGSANVHRWNAAARNGGIAGVGREMGLPGYDLGGIVSGIGRGVVGSVVGGAKAVGNAASAVGGKLKDLAIGALSAGFEQATNPILSALDATIGHTMFGQVAAKFPRRARDQLVGWLKTKDQAVAPPGGTANAAPWSGTVAPGMVGKMQQWALAQRGKTYLWGAAGPQHFDCSGLVSNLYAMATGKAMSTRYFSTANQSGFFAPGAGTFTTYIRPGSHTAANIGGLHVEAYNGDGTPLAIGRIGTPLSYYTKTMHLPGMAAGGILPKTESERIASFMTRGWPEPPRRLGIPFDSGIGTIPPGHSIVHNGTGRPETLVAARRGAQYTINIHNPRPERASDSLTRTTQKLTYLGFGGDV